MLENSISESTTATIKTLKISEIELGEQAREDFGNSDGSLVRLGESIRLNGLVQPVVVNYVAMKARYVLISGERRLQAIRNCGGEMVDARVFYELSDLQILEMQIAENMHRKDLNPMEEAQVFNDLADAAGLKTSRQIAELVKCSEDKVSRRRAMLELPRSVRDMIACGKVPLHHANELTKKGLSASDQQTLANRIVRDGLTVDQLRKEVAGIVNPPAADCESVENRAEDDFVSFGSDDPQIIEAATKESWRGRLIAHEFNLKPRVLKALAEHNPAIETIGQLVEWMNAKGDWWAKDIKGVGPGAAEEIAAAMEQFWIDNPDAAGEAAGGDDRDDVTEKEADSKVCVTAKLIITVPVYPGGEQEEDLYDLDIAKLTAVVDSDSQEFSGDRSELQLTSLWRHFTEVIGEMLQEN